LADENTSHRFVSACQRLTQHFPIIHIARWQDGSWLGMDDATLLMSCAEVDLVLVAFDRATLPWHASQVVRAGEDHGGLILFRRGIRSTDHGNQARLLTDFWFREGHGWDWTDRVVYLPKSP
jgi:hypothetical protein